MGKKDGTDKAPKKNKTKRMYKDGLFRAIFKDKKEFLKLYNAIKNTTFGEDTAMEEVTLNSALYVGLKNDVAFRINGSIVVFVEHQSTVNPSIAARMLLYAAETIKPMLEPEALHDSYGSDGVDFPHTEYYVIYNGKRDIPVNQTVRLSSLRRLSGENYPIALDLCVDIYNINIKNDPELLRRCETLLHYETFVELVQEHEKELGLDAAVEFAVEECLRRGILADFLKIHGKGIISMLVKKLKQDRLNEIWMEGGRNLGRKEGREEGWNAGIEQGLLQAAKAMKDKDIDVNTIAEVTGLSVDVILRL